LEDYARAVLYTVGMTLFLAFFFLSYCVFLNYIGFQRSREYYYGIIAKYYLGELAKIPDRGISSQPTWFESMAHSLFISISY
jgi:hypothetical protein